ncbi:MAG: hypothetical protein WCI73_18410, partial [Phycisphaerae bacterium]
MPKYNSTKAIAGCLLAASLAACQSSPPSATAPASLTTHYNPTPAKANPTTTPTAPTTNPAGLSSGSEGGVITPEMLESLRQLSAEDFQTRQDAIQKLQVAMTRHFQKLVLMQDLMLKIQDNLAEQFRQMKEAPESEKDVRVATLMDFNQALSKWAIDTLNQPPERRDPMLKWGLSPAGYPLVVRAYSRKAEVRAAVTTDLAKLDSAQATMLLGLLLDDPDREVSLTAMNAIWDKPLTAQNLDNLWNRAVGFALQQYRPRPSRQKNVMVHGRMVTIYEQENYQNRMQDADIAGEVLIHAKSPLVTDRLNSLFKEMSGNLLKNPNDMSWRLLSQNYGGPAQIINKLVEAYKPKEVYPFIVKLISNPLQQDGYFNQINNASYWLSMRVDAMGILLKITNQNAEIYKIRKIPNFGDRWVLQIEAKQGDQAGAMAEERKTVRKVLVWWQDHYMDYGAEPPPKLPTEAEEKAAAAAAGVGRMPGVIMQGPIIVGGPGGAIAVAPG